MKYICFLMGVLIWLVFAYDIENDRDFMTWMWLLLSLVNFANSYIHYREESQ